MSVQQKQVSDMTSIYKIRELLKAWGGWMNAPSTIGSCRGYPTSASFTHIGEVMSRSVTGIAPSTEVARIHDAMLALAQFNGAFCMALHHKYEYGTPRKAAARQMNTTERTYRDWVSYGENFIAGSFF